jgi:hypothetical protein
VVLAVPIIFWLTGQLGSFGVAVGRVVVFAVPFAAILDLERKRLGGIQTSFWVGNLWRYGIAALSASAIEFAVLQNFSAGWAAFLGATVVGSVVYSVVLWVSGIASKDDQLLIKRLIQREA